MSFDRSKMALKLALEQDISEELALKVVNEFFDVFLVLKKKTRDFNAEQLSPSPLIDAVWHMALLNTKAYASACGSKFVHHDPDGGEDPEEQSKRYANTLRVYAMLFKKQPDPKIWPDAQQNQKQETEKRKRNDNDVGPVKFARGSDRVVLKTLTGKEIAVPLDDTLTAADLLDVVRLTEGGADWRFIFKGKRISGTDNLALLGAVNGSIVHLINNVRGC